MHSEITVFSNILKDTQIHILADSDEQEVVQQVQVAAMHALYFLHFLSVWTSEFFYLSIQWFLTCT